MIVQQVLFHLLTTALLLRLLLTMQELLPAVMTAEGWGAGGGAEGGGGGGPAGVAAVRTDAALSAAEASLRSRSEGLSLQVRAIPRIECTVQRLACQPFLMTCFTLFMPLRCVTGLLSYLPITTLTTFNHPVHELT